MCGSLIAQARRKLVGGLAGDLVKGRLCGQSERPAQLGVGRHPVVALALDVDRAQIRDAGEATGHALLRQTGARVRVARRGILEQDAAQGLVDLGVVAIAGFLGEAAEDRTQPEGGDDRGIKEGRGLREGEGDDGTGRGPR